MSWDKINISIQPPTTAQRRALYRLGCSRSFVKNQVKTKEIAAETISQMIEVRSRIEKEKKINETISPINS